MEVTERLRDLPQVTNRLEQSLGRNPALLAGHRTGAVVGRPRMCWSIGVEGPYAWDLLLGELADPRPLCGPDGQPFHPSCSSPLPLSQGITGAGNPGGAQSLPSSSLAPVRHLDAKQVGIEWVAGASAGGGG